MSTGGLRDFANKTGRIRALVLHFNVLANLYGEQKRRKPVLSARGSDTCEAVSVGGEAME
jgi:hypothetical protein